MSSILEGQNFVTKEELKRIQKGSATSVWHNPVDNCIYTGERVNNKGEVVPSYEAKIFDVSEYLEAKSLKDAGKLDKDELPYKGWQSEFLDLATERFQMKEAGVITNAQFSAIDTTTVLNQLRNVGIRQFSIPEAVENISTNGLEYEIDVFTRFNVSLNVPEGVAAWSKRGNVATTSFDLTKDVGHFSATDESLLKSRQNLWQAHLTNVATDFRRAKAAKLADVLEGHSATNVGDWDAFTSGLSDANPLAHIQARQDAIEANNGNVDTIVSANTGWTAFVGNTFIRGAYNRQKEGQMSSARTVSIDLLPGITWYIDNELVSDSVIIMDKSSTVCVNGPTRVGQYRLEAEGIDGYVAREWYQCQIVESGKGAELTSVTT